MFGARCLSDYTGHLLNKPAVRMPIHCLCRYAECRDKGDKPSLAVELAMHGTLLTFCQGQ